MTKKLPMRLFIRSPKTMKRIVVSVYNMLLFCNVMYIITPWETHYWKREHSLCQGDTVLICFVTRVVLSLLFSSSLSQLKLDTGYSIGYLQEWAPLIFHPRLWEHDSLITDFYRQSMTSFFSYSAWKIMSLFQEECNQQRGGGKHFLNYGCSIISSNHCKTKECALSLSIITIRKIVS